MKNNKLILPSLLILMLTHININAQTTQIGNQTTGVTATGNTISILNGNKSISVSGLSPVASGVASITADVLKTDNSQSSSQPSNISASDKEKLDSAKNEILAAAKNLTSTTTNVKEEKKPEENNQRPGQDLILGKQNIVTNNIGYYNKTTINQIELKAIDELNDKNK